MTAPMDDRQAPVLEEPGPVDAPDPVEVAAGPLPLAIPEVALVVLVGVSGAGKSTFARRHFLPTQVLSSDTFRGLVADDENDQSANTDAFDVLNYIAGKRLAAGRLTVVDATNVQAPARAPLVRLAREHDVLPVAIVLDLPVAVCAARNDARADRDFGTHVIRRQRDQLRRSLRGGLQREGFSTVHVLRSAAEVGAAEIVLERLRCDRRDQTGPFDVIGDVHGCLAELEALLTKLGYELARDERGRPGGARHPEGRRAILLGDLVDRGPDSPGVLRLAMGMAEAGDALVVPGNHESKLVRWHRGRKVHVNHGLERTIEQLAAEPEAFRDAAVAWLDGLVAHLVLDGGRLVVAHAGLKADYHGRASRRVREFALYGDTTGETDEFGLPVRYPWAQDYRGSATVLYGHTPIPAPEWVNNTMCLDTGCVFGGRLTALRYPERELVSVPAERTWYEPVRPLAPEAEPAPPADGVAAAHREPDLLDVGDVTGKRVVTTRLLRNVTVQEEQAAAALEVLSRFALDPRWLLWLPPTMAPCATAAMPELLEHPAEAFSAYRADGIAEVVAEEKHMGSRAVVLVCADGAAAGRRFVPGGPTGAVWTRTGRAFLADGGLTEALLARVRAAIGEAGVWAELGTDWLLLDCELLPWSAKAEGLLREQYAAVGAAARATMDAAVALLERSARRDPADPARAALLDAWRARAANAGRFTDAYRRYCWPTEGLDGLRLAPFSVLAGEGATFLGRERAWHLGVAERLARAEPGLLAPTRSVTVDLTDPASEAAATAWWEELTAAGGEGMVVKPAAGLVGGRRGPAQPGLKVRGREYLRLIYGPDYTEPANLERLRDRRLGFKRSLALREHALGVEALERAARGEPLWRVHECVAAVLALESEPVDPRL